MFNILLETSPIRWMWMQKGIKNLFYGLVDCLVVLLIFHYNCDNDGKLESLYYCTFGKYGISKSWRLVHGLCMHIVYYITLSITNCVSKGVFRSMFMAGFIC